MCVCMYVRVCMYVCLYVCVCVCATPRTPTCYTLKFGTLVLFACTYSTAYNMTFICLLQIGTEFMRGVSGGEKKRTNIAMELITSPQVLFLDEPTTGLDANTAYSVMHLLQRY